MKNTMADLRNHLFETLENLRDPEMVVDKERAKLIAQVSQTIINTAKVEVDFLKATGERPGNKFFEQKQIA